MQKIILTIILGIFLLLPISAVSIIYAGETTTIDIEQNYEYYSIVGNSSEVVLNIIEPIINSSGVWITITPDKYSANDNYEILFFDIEKEKSTVYLSSGSGRKTRYIDRNIIKYKDRNITEYVDKIVEKEVKTPAEVILDSIPKNEKGQIVLTIILIIIILILILILAKKKINSGNAYDKIEKEVKKDE